MKWGHKRRQRRVNKLHHPPASCQMLAQLCDWSSSKVSRIKMQVLKLEVGRRPGVLGSSVFGYGDAHAALSPTLQRWRAAFAAAAARGR